MLPFTMVRLVLLSEIAVGLSATLPDDALRVKEVGSAVHCAYKV